MRTARTASTRCAIAAAALLAASGTLAACGGSSKTSGVKGASEVTAEPVSSTGANPFTAAVGADSAGVKPPAAAAGQGTGPATYSGSTPGLYGGTRNHRTCDAEKLITFLEQNPGKAAAWAQTLGIQPSQIREYVSGLTAVILRTDTRVTNHGYVDGHANPIQSVLEAGTAVLVDRYGRPVVKCYCGNPLTPPELLTTPTYVGPRWTDFDTSRITIIHQSTTIIKIFTIYDLDTGKTFPRVPGANGTDGAYNQVQPPATNTNTGTTPPTQQAPAPPSTHTETTQSPTTCPPGEVPDPTSSDGCSEPTTSTHTTTTVCPDAGPQICGDTSTGTSTDQMPHGSNGSGPSG